MNTDSAAATSEPFTLRQDRGGIATLTLNRGGRSNPLSSGMVAAGCQLVWMCDLAVASDQAQFGLPGIKSGLFCTTLGVGVARNLPRKFAMEMLPTGDVIDARTPQWRCR